MKSQEPSSKEPPPPSKAEIYSAVTISNAFLVDIELKILAEFVNPRIEFGPYRGEQRNRGYRLSYVGGKAPFFELTRFAYGGSSVIETSEAAPTLNDGGIHTVQWRRYEDGNMVVMLDGKELLSTMDRANRYAFDGFHVINHAGDYAVSKILIYGTKK
ncbi:MAG: hypothetical protein JRJ85_13250 [Deltaproteobacteria bacterium]|nr:hypothetical protein [Deltaproteobacteria bacterium]